MIVEEVVWLFGWRRVEWDWIEPRRAGEFIGAKNISAALERFEAFGREKVKVEEIRSFEVVL